MNKTDIEWCDFTWNPVSGCSKVSSGCEGCYAERHAHRFWGERKFTDVRCHPERLDAPLRRKKPTRIFVNSMSDLWHDEVPVEFLLAIWAVMEAAPQHTYIIPTKRPERMRDLISAAHINPEPSSVQPDYERREIPGWPGYYVDTEGAAWSSRRGTLRKLTPCVTSKWGHAHVTLHAGVGALPRQEKIHRLVLITFDRPPEPSEEACHRNGNPTDNRISNLRWGTSKENGADRIRHGNAVTRRSLTANDIAELRIDALKGIPHRELARRFDISHTQVGRIVRGESWTFRPLPNVHLGVSVENQQTADERIPHLLNTPAAVRFVSYEPAIGPVDLFRFLQAGVCTTCEGGGEVAGNPLADDGLDSCPDCRSTGEDMDNPGLDWVIAGGESGPGARPMHPDWARSVRDQCQAAGVPFFFKQWGEYILLKEGDGREGAREFYHRVGKAKAGHLLDGKEWRQMPEGVG